MGIDNNYFSIADNAFMFFKDNYDRGNVYNEMASMSQSICERYLKSILDEYFIPVSSTGAALKTELMHSHSTRKLIRYLVTEMHLNVSRAAVKTIDVVNGYYYDTRYPGDNFVVVSKEDLDECYSACLLCRGIAKRFIKDDSALSWCRKNAPNALKTENDDTVWGVMSGSYFDYVNEQLHDLENTQ